LGSVMGALFEPEDAPADSPQDTPRSTAPIIPPPVVSSPMGSLQTAVQGVDADLVNKIRSGTFAVPSDYVSFMDAAKLLEGIIPDEGMRLKAALASSKFSATQIAQALATTHTDALNGVVALYKTEREKKFAKDVTSKLSDAKRLGSDIQALEKQVAQIQADIQANRTKQAALSGEAESARVLIEGADANFASAQATVAAELVSLTNKIKSL
jgi:hypothetical protein